MSRIRGKGNRSTELTFITLMRREKISGWRRGARVYGRPDFVFPREKVAVFVDGCFWHGCPKHFRMPASNTEYWSAKILTNRRRDAHVTRKLRSEGWSVFRIWEHHLRPRAPGMSARIGSLRRALESRDPGTAPA